MLEEGRAYLVWRGRPVILGVQPFKHSNAVWGGKGGRVREEGSGVNRVD